MRIGLISDTHGDLEAWLRAVDLLGEIDLMLHAGDHLYHGVFNPVLETYVPGNLAQAMNESPFPILHAKGNCDSEVDQNALNDPILDPYALLMLENAQIMVIHGDRYDEAGLFGMAERLGVKIIVRGHTHISGIKERGGIIMVNPGSPSLPKGDCIPSVGLIEEKTVKILSLGDGTVTCLKEIA